MKIIENNYKAPTQQIDKRLGRKVCYMCNSIIEIEASDLHMTLGNPIPGPAYEEPEAYWTCPCCHGMAYANVAKSAQ